MCDVVLWINTVHITQSVSNIRVGRNANSTWALFLTVELQQ
jgi:hypothetical protein